MCFILEQNGGSDLPPSRRGTYHQSLTEEYNLGKGIVTYWLKQYREECEINKSTKQQFDSYAENLRLRKENADLKKEIEFLMPQDHIEKVAAFLTKEMK